MAIQSSEIKWYKPLNVSDTNSNGGPMSHIEIPDNVKNNVWPDVPQAERTTGSTKYRKTFIKIANDDDLPLIAPRIFIETPTPGDDLVVLMEGTQTDTQTQAITYARCYGCGQLESDALSGDTTIPVMVENGNNLAGNGIFQTNDLIRISDKEHVNAVTGNTQFLRLAASNAVSWNGNLATLTLASSNTLEFNFSATNTRVASVIETDDITTSITGWQESTTAGTYNETTHPVTCDHIGTIEENWTLTFSNATQFTCAGARVGTVGSGSISSSFAPNNPNFNKPYFTLSGGTPPWGGTWASGDTLSWTTHPAAVAIWEKRQVPAGTNSHAGNKVVVAISGESA
ncbi:MAG: hypothetical protein G8237_04935 [Magnetococcales bacterium]|nr:hypothetical protein [Magnetococcales bacterium]NGZ05681.1 hypothetical protein [Magnetococcales bacterium]